MSRIKALVTGGTGFLGSHLADELENYYGMTVFRWGSSTVDLRTHNVEYAMRVVSPDIVFHCAGNVGGIEYNKKNPSTLFRDNILMGVNVLEACVQTKVHKVLMVGTTCSYPAEPVSLPFKESEIFDGMPESTNAPYGIAKRALITAGIAYHNQHGLKVVNAIPANMYGPWDCFDDHRSHVIPAIIKKMHIAKKNKCPKVKLWGSGNASRDFLYVRDAAQALAKLMLFFDSPNPVNVGTSTEVTIRDLSDMIKDVVKYDGEIEWSNDSLDGQPRRSLNCDLIRESVNWQPEVCLREGLERTYEWFLQNVGSISFDQSTEGNVGSIAMEGHGLSDSYLTRLFD